jgi:O-antigen ligase
VTGGSEGVVEQVQSVGDLTIDGPDPTGIPGWLPWVRADSTLGIRIQQYVAAVDLFGYAPFVGIGGGNFSWYAAVYGIPVPPGHPLPLALHNLYLSLLVETGLPGLLTFAAAAGTVLWYSGRSVVDAAAGRIFETTDGVLAAGALAGLLGFLSIAFWDTVQIQITAIVPFWVVAGALVGDRLGWTRGGATDGS